MMLSLDELESYGSRLSDISARAVEDYRSHMAGVAEELGPFSGWDSDAKDRFRDEAIDKMVEIGGTWGDASASIGTMLFERALGEDTESLLTIADSITGERASKSARYWAKFLYGDDADINRFLDGTSTFVDRAVSHSADASIVDSAEDAGERGVRIRYARVPRGPSCGFCVMLASRGFVYASREDAGGGFNRFHDHCDCRVVAGFDGMEVEGYHPEKLYERYSACRNAALGGRDAADPENRVWRAWKALSDDGRAKYVDRQGNASFNEYLERAICAEMDTRDRQWLHDGTPPEITYETPELEAEKKKHRIFEIDTANRLRKCGLPVDFIVDEKREFDPRAGDVRTVGYADLANGYEIKTLFQASSKNTLNGYLKQTSKKKNAVAVVFDNTDNESMSDEELINILIELKGFRRGRVYVIGKDVGFVRVR